MHVFLYRAETEFSCAIFCRYLPTSYEIVVNVCSIKSHRMLRPRVVREHNEQ